MKKETELKRKYTHTIKDLVLLNPDRTKTIKKDLKRKGDGKGLSCVSFEFISEMMNK